MKSKDQVLIETMFKYSDMGIEVNVLTEAAGVQSSILLEASEDAASLFTRLNDSRKELMKSVQNIDWKEWVKKMKDTVAKIIRFITAPARTAADLATGKTTIKEVLQRLKNVLSNLKNKKNKTPEERTAEKAVDEMVNMIDTVSEKIDEKIEDVVDNTEKVEELKQRPIDPIFEKYNEGAQELSSKLVDLEIILTKYLRDIDNVFTSFTEDKIESEYVEYKKSAEFTNLDRIQKDLYEEVIKYQTLSVIGVHLNKAARAVRGFLMNLPLYDASDRNNVESKYNEIDDMCARLSYYPRYCSSILTHLTLWSKDNYMHQR